MSTKATFEDFINVVREAIVEIVSDVKANKIDTFEADEDRLFAITIDNLIFKYGFDTNRRVTERWVNTYWEHPAIKGLVIDFENTVDDLM